MSSWTDENGTLHFSNSQPPPVNAKGARTRVMRGAEQVGSPRADRPDIPFVILNRDRSQRFVRTVLEGPRHTKQVLMLVDTGAQISLIDEALARELALEHVQDVHFSGATGVGRGWVGRLRALHLGDEEVRDLMVMVGPQPGMRLLGMDVLGMLKLTVGQKSLQWQR